MPDVVVQRRELNILVNGATGTGTSASRTFRQAPFDNRTDSGTLAVHAIPTGTFSTLTFNLEVSSDAGVSWSTVQSWNAKNNPYFAFLTDDVRLFRFNCTGFAGGTSVVVNGVTSGISSSMMESGGLSETVDQGAPNAVIANAWPVEVTDGTNVLGTGTHPVRTDPTGTTAQPITGSITASGTVTADQGSAAAATAGWPVVGGVGTLSSATWNNATAQDTALTVVLGGYSNISVGFHPSGERLTGTAEFEVSHDGSAPWHSIDLANITNNTVVSSVDLTTAAKAWQMYVGGFHSFRVRLSVAMTGTGSVTFHVVPTAFACEPAVSVGGTVTSNQGSANATPWNIQSFPGTTGGLTPITGTIGATATAVKASAGQIYHYYIFNPNVYTVYCQLFDVAAASVTLGNTAPTLSFGIPAGLGCNCSIPCGMAFATAIAVAFTTGRATNGAPASTVDYNFGIK